jgi:hypothetical protein
MTVDGKPIRAQVINGYAIVDDVGSGTHTFRTSGSPRK